MRLSRRQIWLSAALCVSATLATTSPAFSASFAERLKQVLRQAPGGEVKKGEAVLPPPDMVEELTEETERVGSVKEGAAQTPERAPRQAGQPNVASPDVTLPWLRGKRIPEQSELENDAVSEEPEFKHTDAPGRVAPAETRSLAPSSTQAAPGRSPLPSSVLPADPAEPPLSPEQEAFKTELIARFPSGKAFVRRFYAARLYAPVWYERGKVKRDPSDFLDWMASSFADGLDPARYKPTQLRAALESGHAGVGEDVALTASLLRFISDLQSGASPAELRQQMLAGGGPVVTPEKRLERILKYPKLQDVPLEDRPAPPGDDYRALKDGLAFYRSVAEHGDFPMIPAGGALKPGARGERILALRARLKAEGYDVGPATSSVFDVSLRSALAEFQRRHGLNPDGSVGPKTLAALAVSAAERVLQIELNLERRRWFPRESGPRYILVNIPSYSVRAMDEGKPPLEMKVVVGEPVHQTPSFSSLVEAVVFHPHWYVPERLVREKYLPKILANPSFVYEHHFEIFEKAADNSWVPVNPRSVTSGGHYRLRQRPGDSNALGRIKFEIRNDMSIYMHGTSAPQLFKESERSLSSGCIRLEQPLQMAFYALEGQKDFDNEKITAIYDNPKLERRYVTLSNPIPVHLVYWTAWADDKGAVQFRDDVYGRDAELRAALYPAATAPAAGM